MSNQRTKNISTNTSLNFRLVLYKELNKVWEYVRLGVSSPTQLKIETGVCGFESAQTQYKTIDVGSDLLAALRQEGALWQAEGYGKPNTKQLSVMTLHFQLPRWRGAQSNAPWFEHWAEQYLDPIQAVLEATANGQLKHHERISGNYLYYYTVFNPEAAKKSVETIAQLAAGHYALDIYIGKREKSVNIPIDPSIPDYLRSILRGFEQTARILADGIPALLPEADPLKPECLSLLPADRIKGAESNRLRAALKEKWNFDCHLWEPPAGVPHTVCLDTIPEYQKQVVINAIKNHCDGPCYLLECDYGLFKIEPDLLLSGAYEGIAFDETMTWAIYYTQHFSVVFCGEWLATLVGESGQLNDRQIKIG
jgi:hypothetical protein